MDIIIFGFGKAGLLHYNSYKKIQNNDRIFIVDNKKYEDVDSIKKVGKIYKSLEELMESEEINIKSSIIDLCLPHKLFGEFVKSVISEGFVNILVEKPFVVDKEMVEIIKNINLIRIQNYLFSAITKKLKEIICVRNLEPELIITNFSKNRKVDSADYRAFKRGEKLSAFEIEIPHMIYTINDIYKDRSNLMWVDAQNMQIEDNIILRNHGKGMVVFKKSNIWIVHQSDLATDSLERKITIICKGGYVAVAEYLMYEGMNITRSGSVKVYLDMKKIEEVIYEIDDNIYNMIKYAYDKFKNNKRSEYDELDSIELFSDELEEILGYIYIKE